MSICPKNKSSKARRDSRRANWKMSAPNLVKCSKCGANLNKGDCGCDTWVPDPRMAAIQDIFKQFKEV